MPKIINFLLAQRIFVLMLTLLLSAIGLYTWFHLPIDAFPDVTNVQVMILTNVPGFTSVDVEQRVTFPIEQQMRGLTGVSQTRSVSKSEMSQVVVIFEDGTDIYFARQQVFERLSEAKESLPEGCVPEMAPISTGLGEIYQYTLESDELSLTELRTLQDWVVAPQLRPIKGVAEINSFGGFVKQYEVNIDPLALEKFDLDMRTIIEVLQKNNANGGGSFILQDWQQTFIRSLGLLESIEDIENIVVKSNNGVPILIKDVAKVEYGKQMRQGGVTRDDQGEVVAGMVIMLQDANSKSVVDNVKKQIKEIQKNLPPNVKLDTFYDRTSLIEACIATVVNAISEGALCVIFVLFLFLAEFRTALTVLLSIPITFLLSFIVMDFTGISSNLMSLGGLAFSVGMVVDATIVVAENVRRHLAESDDTETKLEIVKRGVLEVIRPVTFSVFIVALILTPLFTLQGMEGKMFIPLAKTMLISMVVSLVMAIFIAPPLSYLLLPRNKVREFFFTSIFQKLYEKSLRLLLKHPFIVLTISFTLLIFAGSLVLDLGSDFMPDLDENAIAINSVRLPNASLTGSIKAADQIGRLLLSIPEIKTVVGKTGRAEISEDPMGPEQTDFVIMLKTKEELPTIRPKPEILEEIRAKLAEIPGLQHSYSQPIALRVNELISGIKSTVAIKIFGEDLDILAEIAQEATSIMSALPRAYDVKASQLAGVRQYDIEIDKKTAASHGLNISEVNELIETAVGGKVVSTIIEGQRRFNLFVRFAEHSRTTLSDIMELKIKTAFGYFIPLKTFAKIKTIEVPIEIKRENGIRNLIVEGNVRGSDLGGFISQLHTALQPLEQKLPVGYQIVLGGQFENQQRAMQQLSLVVPVVLLFILLFLIMALGKLRDALLVISILPFALVGGIIALWSREMTFSVSAAIAFIALLGIGVQDGVLLVAFMRQLVNEGEELATAVFKACTLRYRAILMTTLTTYIGLIPMLFSEGAGADLQQPLALVVNGGLVSSTVLTLYFLPILFFITEKYFPSEKVV